MQARSWLPDAVGGVIWFGPAAAHGTIYVPVLAGMDRAPDTLQYGWQGVYNTSTAYWANRRVLNLAQTKFGVMLPHLRDLQKALETDSVQLIGDVVSKVAQALPAPVSVVASASAVGGKVRSTVLASSDLSAIQDVFAANAWRAAFEMNRLFHYLFFTYPDGYKDYWDETGFHSVTLGENLLSWHYANCLNTFLFSAFFALSN